MDTRTIEEIWLDCARDMIRAMLLLPDEYVFIVRVSKYMSSISTEVVVMDQMLLHYSLTLITSQEK